MSKKTQSSVIIVATLLIATLICILALSEFDTAKPPELSDQNRAAAKIWQEVDAFRLKRATEHTSDDAQLVDGTSNDSNAPRPSPDTQTIEADFDKGDIDIAEIQDNASQSLTLEEAQALRELHRAKIAAEYSSSGDGVLTEEDMRRYAEERYIKRRDLNGDGKVDGFELRAISQRKDASVPETSAPSVQRNQ